VRREPRDQPRGLLVRAGAVGDHAHEVVVGCDAGPVLQGAVQHRRIGTAAGVDAERMVLLDDDVQDPHHLPLISRKLNPAPTPRLGNGAQRWTVGLRP
jgi:chloramphenicol 3-O-phosphotransferase